MELLEHEHLGACHEPVSSPLSKTNLLLLYGINFPFMASVKPNLLL